MIKCCHKCPKRWVTETDRCHSTCGTYAKENDQHQEGLKADNTRAWVDGVKKDLICKTKARIAK